jgi:CubicO group peptidase (beta-lactamase class C family)
MRNVRLSAALLLTLSLPAALPAQQAPANVSERLDTIFRRWNTTDAPGCAVGVSQNGRMTLARGYGMADLEHDVPNSPATIFEAGSVSKQFTAAAIILLALDGRLSLDDDVRRYVPEVPDYGRTITIRHMMTHTSGLRDWGSVAAIGGWPRGARAHNHAHVVDIVSRQRGLNFDPGHEYSYSNTGYNLQAVIVERVSGMSFAEFSRQRIFEPAGLRNTQWRDDHTRIVKGRATGYAVRGQGFAIDMPFENVHGNGGLLTTVEDLLIWTEHLENGSFGGPRFREMMHEQGVLNNGRTISYAAGLQVGEFNGVSEVSHTGSTAGYRAYLARYPQQRVGVALLCNVGAVNPGTVGHQVAALYLPEPPQRATGPRTTSSPALPPARPTLTPEQMQQYVGEYYSPDAEVTFNVVLENGSLWIRRRPAARMPLQPLEQDAFSSQTGTIRFIRDAAGRITELSVGQARVYDMRFDRVR